VKKRGLPEGYVRGLEKLWGLAIRDVDEVEDNMLSALSGNEESRNILSIRQIILLKSVHLNMVKVS
jgi:hypothetical protein